MIQLNVIYRERFVTVLQELASGLELFLRDTVSGLPHVDRVAARAKSEDRFLIKASKQVEGRNKYEDPISEIQDQIGARIIVYYLSDVDAVAKQVEKYIPFVEVQDVAPESMSAFSYFGKHYIYLIPDDVINDSWDRSHVPEFFKLQIKTLFQHAWSEASHDLEYKPHLGELSITERRQLAFASAQAWGADRVFQDIIDRHSRAGEDSRGAVGGLRPASSTDGDQ